MRCVSSFLLTIAAFFILSVAVSDAFSVFPRQQNNKVGVPVPPAPADLLIDDTLFNKITAAVVPTINALASNIVIPAINSDHFDIDSFKIENFDLGPITFTFSSPSQVSVSLSQISFNIPSIGFEIKDKILFAHIHCSGHANANVNIAATFSFDLTDTNGQIALAGATAVNIDYKTLQVGYKMDHELCSIVAKFINFIIGGITDKIKDAIEKNLGPAIQKGLTDALSKEFAKLPFTVTGSPSVANGVLTIPINLDSFVHQQQQQRFLASPPRLSSSSRAVRNVGDLTRDIAILLPASSANTLGALLYYSGKLHFNRTEKHLNTTVFRAVIPEAYNLCPGCPLNIDANVQSAPQVSFTSNNFSLSIANLSLSFSAFNESTGALDSLFTVSTNVGFSVGQFSISTNSTDEVIKFALGVQSINLVVTSTSVGKIDDVSTINFIINLIVSTVVPAFNAAFPGVPIPTQGAFTLQDIFVQIGAGTFQAGFNVNI